MMKKLLFALMFAASMVPSLAFAQWDGAFPTDAVGTYVPSSSTKVMVVAVDAKDAAAALSTALSGSAVVIPAAGLGNVSDLSDAEIVTKAAGQPVDQIVIVRTAGSEDAPIAVVTLYRKDGTSEGGYTASAESPAPPSDGGGASQAEMESATSESVAAAEPSDAAREEFLERYVWFQDWVGVNQYGSVVSSWSVPLKGQYQEPLRGREFYEYIEEPELAQTFRKRQTSRSILVWSGVGAMVGGSVVMLAPIFSIDSTSDFNTTPLFVGTGIFVAGTALMLVGAAINPHPVEPSEARKLAVQFNKRLAKDLGLDIEDIGPTSMVEEDDPMIESFDFAVVPTDRGAVVGVNGTF